MIDVHPAPHAAESWREFLIHISTITLGLLIALGLEHTVEYFNHRSQRQELHQDLRAEAQKNLHLFELDEKFYGEKETRLIALREYVDSLREARAKGHTSIDGDLPDLGSPFYWFPSTVVWQTARESSTVPLLPRSEAAVYNEVYFENYRVLDYADRFFDDWSTQHRYVMQFAPPVATTTVLAPPSPVALHNMNADELKQYSGLISNTLEALQNARYVNYLAHKANTGFLAGESVKELQNHMDAPRPAPTAPRSLRSRTTDDDPLHPTH